MMPVLRVNDAIFADLSTLKTWYGTRNPSDTIDRIVRQAMEQLGIERGVEPEPSIASAVNEAMQFAAVPGLTFTKLLSASIVGKALQSLRWSALLLATIRQLRGKGVEGDNLVAELRVPARSGRYEEEGYKYHADLGISVQGQSAADSWKEIDRIAKKWSIPVSVEFRWRETRKRNIPVA